MKTIILKQTTNQKVKKVNYNLHGYSVGGNDALLFDTLIQGTNADDTMNGTEGDDGLRGYDGDDVMFGGAGNDRLAGYAGNNTMYGGSGNDYLYSGDYYAGVNTMNGGTGADHFVINAYESTAMKGSNITVIQDFSSIDTIDINSHDRSLSFSKFDTDNDGLLTTADKGVTALHNADGTTGIQLAISDHYVLQVQNQSELGSSDFTFTSV